MRNRSRSPPQKVNSQFKLHINKIPMHYTDVLLREDFRHVTQTRMTEVKMIKKEGQAYCYGFVTLEHFDDIELILQAFERGKFPYTVKISNNVNQPQRPHQQQPQQFMQQGNYQQQMMYQQPPQAQYQQQMQQGINMYQQPQQHQNYPQQNLQQQGTGQPKIDYANLDSKDILKLAMQMDTDQINNSSIDLNTVNIMVRELWIGGFKPEVSKEQLSSYLLKYGDIENIDIFHNKPPKVFSFVRFAKCDQCTDLYEDIDGLQSKLQAPSLTIYFADHRRRSNIVGDSQHKWLDQSLLPVIYIGFTDRNIQVDERNIINICEKYAKIQNYKLFKPNDLNLKTFMLLQFQSVSIVRQVFMKILDKRTQLGDRKAEITILTNGKIQSNQKKTAGIYSQPQNPQQPYGQPKQVGQQPQFQQQNQLKQQQANQNLPGNFNQQMIQNPQQQIQQGLQYAQQLLPLRNQQTDLEQLSDDNLPLPNWSGSITRNKKDKTLIDIVIHKGFNGKQIDFSQFGINIDVSHKISIENSLRKQPIAILIIYPSTQASINDFNKCSQYFQQKQKGGVINMNNYQLYLFPNTNQILNQIPHDKITQQIFMIGILCDQNQQIDPTRANEKHQFYDQFQIELADKYLQNQQLNQSQQLVKTTGNIQQQPYQLYGGPQQVPVQAGVIQPPNIMINNQMPQPHQPPQLPQYQIPLQSSQPQQPIQQQNPIILAPIGTNQQQPIQLKQLQQQTPPFQQSPLQQSSLQQPILQQPLQQPQMIQPNQNLLQQPQIQINAQQKPVQQIQQQPQQQQGIIIQPLLYNSQQESQQLQNPAIQTQQPQQLHILQQQQSQGQQEHQQVQQNRNLLQLLDHDEEDLFD